MHSFGGDGGGGGSAETIATPLYLPLYWYHWPSVMGLEDLHDMFYVLYQSLSKISTTSLINEYAVLYNTVYIQIYSV